MQLDMLAAYREYYPGMLSWSKHEWDRADNNARTTEAKAWLADLKDDCQRIVRGSRLLQWPNPEILPSLKSCAEEYYAHFTSWRSSIILQFGTRWIEPEFQAMAKHRKQMRNRLRQVHTWTYPFDAIDAEYRELASCVSPAALDDIHGALLRGQAWFGVGEWNLASLLLGEALYRALAVNALETVQMSVALLLYTYTAIGDELSAIALAQDFTRTPAAWAVARSSGGYCWPEIFQALILALARIEGWEDIRSWLAGLDSSLGLRPPEDVSTWEVCRVISDIYKFRDDRVRLDEFYLAMLQLQPHVSAYLSDCGFNSTAAAPSGLSDIEQAREFVRAQMLRSMNRHK